MGLKVVVTGGSSGIGRGAALRFVKDGHDVFITGRSDSNLEKTIGLAKRTLGEINSVVGVVLGTSDMGFRMEDTGTGSGAVYKGVGDVGVEADVIRNYQEATKALGHIDVLVLNAGLGHALPLEDYSAAEYDTTFNTNVRGVFLWLKSALPAFKKQRFGQIVIVNSVSGLQALGHGTSVYTASKYACTGMAEGLRLEVKGTGIKVASVFPGLVDTNMYVT